MFTKLYPVSKDFNNLFEDFTSALGESVPSYPPYNISIDEEEGTGYLEISCVGLTEEDLKVYIDEKNLVVVEGTYPDENKVYSHKGLSKKNFKRKFRLEQFTVKNVELKNGLMTIEVEREQPKEKLIQINTD